VNLDRGLFVSTSPSKAKVEPISGRIFLLPIQSSPPQPDLLGVVTNCDRGGYELQKLPACVTLDLCNHDIQKAQTLTLPAVGPLAALGNITAD
jgi:hypothetical protein